MKIQDMEGNVVILNDREVTVIWYLITGMTSRMIARMMNTPEKTISYCKLRAMKKLKLKNQADLNLWLVKGTH